MQRSLRRYPFALLFVLCTLCAYGVNARRHWLKPAARIAAKPNAAAPSPVLPTWETAAEPAQAGGSFTISPSIVAGGGGGGPSAGGNLTVTGSVGQSALGVSSGGGITIVGGFWGGDAVNQPPTISALSVSRQQGSPVSNSPIANVGDPDQPPETLMVTVNGGVTATINGVTVSGISVSPAGIVTANVVATCTAAPAGFTLTVTDNAAASASTPLNVTVTSNTPPTLSYGNTSVPVGGSIVINPTTATDNGSITGYALVGVSPPLNPAPTINPITGAISITNAAPLGPHAITVRATDNCGVFTDAPPFTLTVCPTITISPPILPIATRGTAYSQMLTPTGGTSPYTCIIDSGSLPPGLLPSPNCTLTGTPSAAGTFDFTVKATDANGCMGTQPYALIVNHDNPPCPTITLGPPIQRFSGACDLSEARP